MAVRTRFESAQLELTYRRWGGKRAGAGRKRVKQGRVPHRKRAALASRFPVHVTMRLKKGLKLTQRRCRAAVRRALFRCSEREGFRIVHYCLLADHLHLICEAKDAAHLARGIQSFAICLARGLNARLGRRGAVFAGRYHAHILRSPTEVKRALLYVINNRRRHEAQQGVKAQLAAGCADIFSSGPWFDGWRRPPENGRAPPPWAPRPRTWLLGRGWRRLGLLDVDAVPGVAANGLGRA